MAPMNGYGLVGIGDNVVDFYRDQDAYYPGGNALNVAVLARRFGLAATAYVGIIGDDEEGEHVRASLLAEGLDDAHLRVLPGATGRAEVTLDATGDRIFVGSNRGGVRKAKPLHLTNEDFVLVRTLGHVHSSCFSYIEDSLPQIAEAALSLSYDFSTGHDPAYLARVCPYVTTAFLSGSDLDQTGITTLIGAVHQLGTSTVCVTRGEKGAIWSSGGRVIEQGIVPATVVDTMGAGDAFIAGYLASAIAGQPAEAALAHGAASAANACSWQGAFGHAKPAISTAADGEPQWHN